MEPGFTSVYLPGSCYLRYDGYSYCDGSSLGYGSTLTVGGPVPGTQLPIRVIAALVVLAAVACYRSGRRELLFVTAGLGLFGLFDGGAIVISGRLLWIVALLAALVVLHRRVTGDATPGRPGPNRS